MDKIKAYGIPALIALVAVWGFSFVSKDSSLGGVPGVNLIPTQGQENIIEVAQTGATTTVSVEHFQSGSTFYLSASGTVMALPAPLAGVHYKFVIDGAVAIVNMVIQSAEGDNIEGSLIVAGAVVDCDANDRIDFVFDGENLGDYVELSSDGTKWFITGSNALTTAKLTCTG
jgi:hypothetical protein